MRYLVILAIIFTGLQIKAQNFLGVQQDNYSGVLSASQNPANIVDSRYRFHMVVAGGSVDFYNSYFSSDQNIFKSINQRKDSVFFSEHISQNISREIHQVYLQNEMVGVSFLTNLSELSAIGFQYKIRTFFNIDGLGSPLAQLSTEKLAVEDLWKIKIQNKSLSVQTMSWAEYAANYARVVYDKEDHFLKAGVTVKLLQGLQSAYMFVDNLTYSFENSDTMSIFESDVNYGHSTNYDFTDNQLQYKFVSNPGLGFDLGVVYEWRPNWQEYKYEMDGRDNMWREDLNKYKLKASFSVLDIGRIRYQRGQYSKDFHADIDSWDISNLGISSVNDLDSIVNNTFNYLQGDTGMYKMNLPTSMNANVDYHIYKRFYVNGMANVAFQFNDDPNKVHGFSNFTLAPRFESKVFSGSIPVSYSSMAKLRVGLGLRVGPIILGTANLAAIFGGGQTYGGDVYFAGTIPVRKKIPKDKDEDHVSNRFDECPDVQGVWEFRGCPDTDNDRIQDSKDDCPAEAGLLEFNGCPDTDRDGIMDKDDECPTLAGSLAMNGCPDRDGDGVKDSEDKCPNIPGIPEFEGCPDTDGDGIMDRKDNCPTEAGPAENYGCPNTVKLHLVDQYGNIIMTTEKTAEGFIFKELPTDKSYMFLLEGEDDMGGDLYIVLDNNGEKTKIVAKLNEMTGYFEYRYLQGTRDVMEIIEEKDESVLLAKEEQEVVDSAFNNLQFETGKAIIAEQSFKSLYRLVELMKAKEDWKIKLTGHTDNVGKASSNLLLSKRRAEAVQFYLIQQGIDKDRIIVKYYGQTKPIADNDTPEGRQKNRRVEMKIIQ